MTAYVLENFAPLPALTRSLRMLLSPVVIAHADRLRRVQHDRLIGLGRLASALEQRRDDDTFYAGLAALDGPAPAASDPLAQAISKLTDVADRQLSLMASVATSPTIHRPTATRAPAVDRPAAAGAPADPPAPAAQSSTAPFFSQIEDEYIAMRQGAGADRGTLSTIGLRAWMFRELMDDKRFDTYLPKDLQDYANLLQYVPVEYTRPGKEHEALQHMSLRWLVERNKTYRCWEPLALKTMQDGYVQVVKTMVSTAVLTHRFHNPFAGMKIRWPDNAKPSVKREALDYEKLNVAFRLGVKSGYIDDAMLLPIAFLSSRRIGILPWIRGVDIDQKHGVDIVRVNGIVFDKANNRYRRVPYKTSESLRFFVLHMWFREIGFTHGPRRRGRTSCFGSYSGPKTRPTPRRSAATGSSKMPARAA